MSLAIDNSKVELARRVLVVDSNPNLRHLYVQALERAGYEVYAATTIQEARRLLGDHEFNVFLSDTHFNNRDLGVGLLLEQWTLFAAKNIKTIVMSSHIQYELICQKMGVDVFLVKPIAIDRLVILVNRLAH